MTLQFIKIPQIGTIEVVNTSNEATIIIDAQLENMIRTMKLNPLKDNDIVRYLKKTNWIHPKEKVMIEWVKPLF